MITMTQEAIARLKEIIRNQGREDLALRLYVTPGGCSGFSYGMALEDETAEDDHVVACDGVKVVIDPFSAQYLQGAQIDYVDALMGGGFQVHNPNAVRSCACGHSFDTGSGASTARPCH